MARALLRRLGRARFVVSAQVLSEFASVLVHPRKQAAPASVAIARVTRLARSARIIPLGTAVVITALEAVDRWGMPFYDAQIWAAAALNGIPVVLSEDFPSGATLGGVRFINPFEPGFDLESL